VAGKVRRDTDQRPEAACRQARDVFGRLPARPAERLPQALPQSLADVAARGRREPGGIGRLRRDRHHGRQLGESETLPLERLLAAQQDAQFGVDDDLDAVVEVVAQAGPEPDVVAPRRGRDGDRAAAAGGHRPSHVQGEPAEQVGGAQERGERGLLADVDLERRRRIQGRPPPRPAAYAVAPVDTAGLILVVQAVPPARRDQQLRLPVVIAAQFLFGHVLHDRRAAAGVGPQAHGRPGAEP
jgi:hypothetical protein